MTKSQKLMQEFRDVAEELLSENQFGSKFVLKKMKASSEFNRKAMKNELSYTEHDGYAVRKNYSAEQGGNLSNLIEAGDVEFIVWMKEEEIVPAEGKDQIVFNGITYNIIRVVEVNPNGTKKICHKCHSRRVQ